MHGIPCAADAVRDGLVVNLHCGQFAPLAPASDLGADVYDGIKRILKVLEVFGDKCVVCDKDVGGAVASE